MYYIEIVNSLFIVLPKLSIVLFEYGFLYPVLKNLYTIR